MSMMTMKLKPPNIVPSGVLMARYSATHAPTAANVSCMSEIMPAVPVTTPRPSRAIIETRTVVARNTM